MAENRDEVRWVAELFRTRAATDVYDHYGLLRPGAFYGHAICTDGTTAGAADSSAAVAHCPTSNLFLGSGYHDFHQSDANRLNVTLATDVGGGASFSMLRTMNAAHKVARMGGYYLTALRMFYGHARGRRRARLVRARRQLHARLRGRLHRARPAGHAADRTPQRPLRNAGRAVVRLRDAGR